MANEPSAVVIVAAGATQDPELARLAPGGNKALTPVNGRPAVSYLVDNLKNCEGIGRVVLIGDDIVRNSAPNADVFVEGDGFQPACIMAGIRATGDAHRVMILAGDMPLASSESLCDLLQNAPAVDLVYPVVEECDVMADFPGRSPYYIGTLEGRYTGSSCLLATRRALSDESLLLTLLEARKNPSALISLVGTAFAMRVMFSKPSLRDFESHLSDRCDFACRVFVSHYPELFVSIDSVQDIAMMERAISYI